MDDFDGGMDSGDIGCDSVDSADIDNSVDTGSEAVDTSINDGTIDTEEGESCDLQSDSSEVNVGSIFDTDSDIDIDTPNIEAESLDEVTEQSFDDLHDMTSTEVESLLGADTETISYDEVSESPAISFENDVTESWDETADADLHRDASDDLMVEDIKSDIGDLHSEIETESASLDDKFEEETDAPYIGEEFHEDIPTEIEQSESSEELGEIQSDTATRWPDEIVDSIRSVEEAEIYKNADLIDAEINGKKCLVRSDLDMEQKDEFGRTNKERMENDNAPLTENGETVELHHIGQKQDSPLAELTTQEHRGKGNDTVLHDKQKETEIDRGEFAKERKQYWKSRAENT